MDPRAKLAREISEQLADEDAQAARVAFCRATTEAIQQVGRVLYVGGDMLRDDSARGLSLTVRMGGALASGICDLLSAGNAYAAAALARQFVEIEYLLYTFADDSADASRWVNASRNHLSRHFTPAAMRERSGGRFRSEEYKAHCDNGGHPNPAGWHLIADDPPVDSVLAGWADLAQHLERAWGFLATAYEEAGYGKTPDEYAEAVERAQSEWHTRDLLADWVVLPGDGAAE